MFWTAGSCNRAFDCTFKHMKGSGATAGLDSNGPGSSLTNSALPSDGDSVDFFSSEGLAVNIGAGREERHNLTPVEAHNHLKPFLRDNYHFDRAANVQGFVRILASVNDRNKAWVRRLYRLPRQHEANLCHSQNSDNAQVGRYIYHLTHPI